jgi:tubby-related protein 1
MATATTPNPKATARARREPLRPRSNNAATSLAVVSARRGPAASAEKENQRPKSLAHGKEEEDKGKAAAAAATTTAELSKPAEPAPAVVAPPTPPQPLKPSSLQLRMKDESAEAAAAQAPPAFVVGPRGRELLLPPPSSNYEAWDLSDSESAPASSWATLPNRYAAPRLAARPFSPPPPRDHAAASNIAPSFPCSRRALLCWPLPQDVGRCTCVIVREAATGARGVALYSLYTNVR